MADSKSKITKKVEVTPGKDGKVNVGITANISTSVQSEAAKPAQQQPPQMQSIKDIEAKKSPESKEQQQKPSIDKTSTSNNELTATLKVLTDSINSLQGVLVALGEQQKKLGAGKGEGGGGKTPDLSNSIGTALIQAFADKSFERSLIEGFRRLSLNEESLNVLKSAINDAVGSLPYSVNDSEKAVSTKSGEGGAFESSLSNEQVEGILGIKDAVQNIQPNDTASIAETIDKANGSLADVITGQFSNLNTESSDETMNALNAQLKQDAAEIKASQEEQIAVQKETTEAVKSSAPKADAETKEMSQLLSVNIASVDPDLKIGDKDIKTLLEDNMLFVEDISKNMTSMYQVDEDQAQQLALVASQLHENSEGDKKEASIEKQATTIAEKPADDVGKTGNKIINDPMTGELEGVNRKKEQSLAGGGEVQKAAGPPGGGGITGLGKGIAAAGGKEKGAKGAGGAAAMNGLGKAVAMIGATLGVTMSIIARIYNILPAIANSNRQMLVATTNNNVRMAQINTSVNGQIVSAVNSTNTGVKQVNTSLAAVLAAPRTLVNNITDRSIVTKFGVDKSKNTKVFEIQRHAKINSLNKINSYNRISGGGDTAPIVDLLKNILSVLQAGQQRAQQQADAQRKENEFKKNFGEVKSGSKATAKGADGSSMMKGISKMMSNLSKSILSGLAGATMKTRLALVGIISMIIGFIMFLKENPEILNKVMEWIKETGAKIWNKIKEWWDGASPQVQNLVIAIAGVMSFIIFGPWGLIVPAVMKIYQLWPKYKGYIIAIGAVVATALGYLLAAKIKLLLAGKGMAGLFSKMTIKTAAQMLAATAKMMARFAIFIGRMILQALIATGHALAAYLGPIGIVIAALVLVFVVLMKFFPNIAKKLWNGIKAFGGIMLKVFTWPIQLLMKVFPGLGKKIKSALVSLFGGIPFVGKFIKKMFGGGEEGTSGEESDGSKEKEEAKEEGKEKEAEFEKSEGGGGGGSSGGGGGDPETEKKKLQELTEMRQTLTSGLDNVINGIRASQQANGMMLRQILLRIPNRSIMTTLRLFAMIGAVLARISSGVRAIKDVKSSVDRIATGGEEAASTGFSPFSLIRQVTSGGLNPISIASSVMSIGRRMLTNRSTSFMSMLQSNKVKSADAQTQLVSYSKSTFELLNSAMQSSKEPNASQETKPLLQPFKSIAAGDFGGKSLVNMRSSIENTKAEITNNNAEKIAASEAQAESMNDERIRMLPSIIAMGLSQYFDNKGFKINNGEQPTLVVNELDRVDNFG